MKMSKKTAERLTQKLIYELQSHEHRDELVSLITEQLIDDDMVGTDRTFLQNIVCLSLVFSLKRVNINIPDECHHLLKTTCVALGVSINDFVHQACQEAIRKHANEDEHLRNVVASLNYPEDTLAAQLQKSISIDH